MTCVCSTCSTCSRDSDGVNESVHEFYIGGSK